MVLTLGYLSNSWVSLSLIDGVLQVAEKLMNPFGDDDDHFEINGILDSNLEVSHWVSWWHQSARGFDSRPGCYQVA